MKLHLHNFLKIKNGIAEYKDIQSVLSSNPIEKESKVSNLSDRKIIKMRVKVSKKCRSSAKKKKVRGKVSVFLM